MNQEHQGRDHPQSLSDSNGQVFKKKKYHYRLKVAIPHEELLELQATFWEGDL